MRFLYNEKISFFSSIIVISVLTFLGITFFVLFWITFRQTISMNYKSISEFTENYSMLYEGLNSPMKKKLIIVWKPMNLLR
jgi:hypothetical protein